MDNILISGAPNTGKSIIANSLSYIVDLPIVKSRTYSEVSFEYNLNKNVLSLGFNDLFTVGFSNFTDRTQLEYRYQNGFISDGSIINDLISMKLYLSEKSQITHKIFKWISNKRYINECLKMLNSFERLVIAYSKNQYYSIIHLETTINSKISGNDAMNVHIEKYNQELILFYKRAGLQYTQHSNQDFIEILEQIVLDKNLKTIISPSNALLRAFDEMHIGNLNNPVINTNLLLHD